MTWCDRISRGGVPAGSGFRLFLPGERHPVDAAKQEISNIVPTGMISGYFIWRETLLTQLIVKI